MSDSNDRPIYLCTQQQLVGDATEERALQQLRLLGDILDKLGYQMMSGEAPRFHELWAAPKPAAVVAAPAEPQTFPEGFPKLHADPVPPAVRDIAADAFERRFLAWLHIQFGIFPERQAGTNAFWWKFNYGASEIEMVVVGRQKNTAAPPAPETDWLLRIEESEPIAFILKVAEHFTPGSGVRRRMHDGRTRMQFKSSELLQEFIDQTEGTW